MSAQLHRTELLELDIDTRLADLWAELPEFPEVEEAGLLETFACFMRAAYGRGSVDALIEPKLGELCRAHGSIVPERRAA